MKLNLAECTLDNKQNEEFLAKLNNFHDVFSLRDEIGTCPFIEVHLKLKDETPLLVGLFYFISKVILLEKVWVVPYYRNKEMNG